MSDVGLFLEKSKALIGDSEADFEAVKTTLEALRKISPDLVDSKIFERLSRLVDSAQIARDTQIQVLHLMEKIDEQQKRLDQLTQQTQVMKQSFDQLHNQMVRDNESDRQTRQKKNFVLDELEQWLRRHS